MDYGMIGKIEKSKLYASEPERVTFNTLVAEFRGDNNNYRITLSPGGWACTCPGFKSHSICPHIMALEKLYKAELKRAPLPYAPGQNVVSDVDKAMRYADEPDRLDFVEFEVTFRVIMTLISPPTARITSPAAASSSTAGAYAATPWRWSGCSRIRSPRRSHHRPFRGHGHPHRT